MNTEEITVKAFVDELSKAAEERGFLAASDKAKSSKRGAFSSDAHKKSKDTNDTNEDMSALSPSARKLYMKATASGKRPIDIVRERAYNATPAGMVSREKKKVLNAAKANEREYYRPSGRVKSTLRKIDKAYISAERDAEKATPKSEKNPGLAEMLRTQRGFAGKMKGLSK